MSETYFILDGRKLNAEEGSCLIDAAMVHGIHIPSLCYYPHINPPLATCRVCSVQVDGRMQAACLVKVREGMEVVFDTPELADERKAVLELMFAEGNHYCPSCEKDGDCDLQHLGRLAGVTATRFPHLFDDRLIDFKPQRLVIEHNRCIKCMRCVEEVHAPDGRKVFSFIGRGHETRVGVDYQAEALLTEEQAERAMHICPVGAILVRGKSLGRPPGERRYDDLQGTTLLPQLSTLQKSFSSYRPRRKLRVATTSLAGCFGCHMSMLDIDLGLLDVVDFIQFGKSPLNDIKTLDERCDIGLVEGGCSNTDNVEVLREFRRKCDILVSVGECAINGGIPAMRNTLSLEECLEESYLHSLTSRADEQIIPAHDDLPKILDRVYACHEVVKIDYWIAGCPPSSDQIWEQIFELMSMQNEKKNHD